MKKTLIMACAMLTIFCISACIGLPKHNNDTTESSFSSESEEEEDMITLDDGSGTKVPKWIIGIWKCESKYGTSVYQFNTHGVVFNDDNGSQSFGTYTYTGSQLKCYYKNLDGVAIVAEVDHTNKRLGAGRGYYFRKISDN